MFLIVFNNGIKMIEDILGSGVFVLLFVLLKITQNKIFYKEDFVPKVTDLNGSYNELANDPQS